MTSLKYIIQCSDNYINYIWMHLGCNGISLLHYLNNKTISEGIYYALSSIFIFCLKTVFFIVIGEIMHAVKAEPFVPCPGALTDISSWHLSTKCFLQILEQNKIINEIKHGL